MAGAVDEPRYGIIRRVRIHPSARSLIVKHRLGDESFTKEKRMMNLFAMTKRTWFLIGVGWPPKFLARATI